MELILTSKHELLGSGYFIGVDNENISEQLIITIPEELLNKWAYLEFQVNDGEKYNTPKLDIIDNKITYAIPNGLLEKGYVKVQVIFRDDTNFVWKSFEKKFHISDAINACQNLPDEYPDFITEAQKLLDEISVDADKVDQVLATETARVEAENIRVSNENTRIANENARISAETERSNKEVERKSNEVIRQQNETQRVSAEATRQTTFNEWKDNLGNLNTYDKRLINLEEAGVGTIFDYQVDKSVAYSKNVSSKALPYALLNKVGGMTYKQDSTLNSASVTSLKSTGKNLFDISKIGLIQGSNIAITNVTDNSITITTSGEYVSNGSINTQKKLKEVAPSLVVGSTYILSAQTVSAQKLIYLYDTNDKSLSKSIKFGSSFIVDENDLERLVYFYGLSVQNGQGTGDCVISNIQIEEGSTATAYEPYKENNISIPSGIQVLDGYGLGINDTCYNYIDFDRKVFVQKVKKYVMTGFETQLVYNLEEKFSRLPIENIVASTEVKVLSNMFIDRQNWTSTITSDYSIFSTGTNVYFYIQSMNSLEEYREYFKNNKVEIVYALTEPIETDISAYIEDNYIKVYQNGSLVFNNENNLAVPSEITYVVKK